MQQLGQSLSPPQHRSKEPATSWFQRVITQLDADVVNFSTLNVVTRAKVYPFHLCLRCDVCMHSDKKIYAPQMHANAICQIERLLLIMPKKEIGLSSPMNVLRNPPLVKDACRKRFQRSSGPGTSAYEKGKMRRTAASPGSSVFAEIPWRQRRPSVRKRILK